MTATKSNLLDLTEDNDVKAFIYQQFVDFEPFVTPETFLTVELKDPMKLLPAVEAGVYKGIDKKNLKNMVRISISLVENGAKLEAEGLSDNIYQAITKAKESALSKLIKIQDKVITAEERAAEVNVLRKSGDGIH